MTKPKYSMRRLIFLVYKQGLYVTRTKPDNVELDLQAGTWKVEEGINSPFRGQNRSYKIGIDSRIAVEKYQRSGIIGVYDTHTIDHLNSLISAALRVEQDDPTFAEVEDL